MKKKDFSKAVLSSYLPICNSSCVNFPRSISCYVFAFWSLSLAYEISNQVLTLHKEPTSHLFPTKLPEGRASQSRLIESHEPSSSF